MNDGNDGYFVLFVLAAIAFIFAMAYWGKRPTPAPEKPKEAPKPQVTIPPKQPDNKQQRERDEAEMQRLRKRLAELENKYKE